MGRPDAFTFHVKLGRKPAAPTLVFPPQCLDKGLTAEHNANLHSKQTSAPWEIACHYHFRAWSTLITGIHQEGPRSKQAVTNRTGCIHSMGEGGGERRLKISVLFISRAILTSWIGLPCPFYTPSLRTAFSWRNYSRPGHHVNRKHRKDFHLSFLEGRKKPLLIIIALCSLLIHMSKS